MQAPQPEQRAVSIQGIRVAMLVFGFVSGVAKRQRVCQLLMI
jgi:hypothetical protein